MLPPSFDRIRGGRLLSSLAHNFPPLSFLFPRYTALRKIWTIIPLRCHIGLDKAPGLIFILIQYLSNSTKQQILGRQYYLGQQCGMWIFQDFDSFV